MSWCFPGVPRLSTQSSRGKDGGPLRVLNGSPQEGDGEQVGVTLSDVARHDQQGNGEPADLLYERHMAWAVIPQRFIREGVNVLG
jgi:hypothetical protein